MTHGGTGLGINAHVSHAAVALKALAMISSLESRHPGGRGIRDTVAIFASHETSRDRAPERRRCDAMAFMTRRACVIAMLMMTLAAIARNGSVFLVVEQYGLIFIDQAVQFNDPGGGNRTRRLRYSGFGVRER
jgi:hypothetical protein